MQDTSPLENNLKGQFLNGGNCMNNRGYANMMLGKEKLSRFIHTLLLLAVLALPEGFPFEAPDEDLQVTGELKE